MINNRYRSGFSSLSTIQDKLLAVNGGQPFPYLSPYFERFNDEIRRMIDAGLTNMWLQKTHNPRGLINKNEKIGPEILTMEHLEVAFKIIIILMAISVVVFLAEILCFHVISSRAWKTLFQKHT